MKKLKKGAPFLIYLYYTFDNKPLWHKLIWNYFDFLRRMISKMPFIIKIIDILIYFPLEKASVIFENLGLIIQNIPIYSYIY